MDRSEIYRALEEEFVATFIKELIPGILHNFANPLNSIMGRSKLLQRRTEDIIKKIEEIYPETAGGMKEDLQRIRTEIRAVNQESELFFDLFKSVTSKFYTLDAKGESRINISQLLSEEIHFFNFYLDFKHEIKKVVQLTNDVPSFRGNRAELSLAFWKLIRFAMSRALSSSLKEFQIQTECDNRYVSVFIKNSGDALPASDIEALMENMKSGSREITAAVIDRAVLFALLILNKYKARINIFTEENFSILSIGFPYTEQKN
jgi:signal transduction histidine kinase